MFLKTTYALLITTLLFISASAQPSDFETKEWNTPNTDKPLLFYISGDGGFNSFSNSLCSTLNKQGYPVIALDAKKYFWDKKTPEQTRSDIENFLAAKIVSRKNKHCVFIGYSFGADVLPFLLTRFSVGMNQYISNAILMASSGSTDFEIHWTDMFGSNRKRSMDVVTEINKVTSCRLIHISGDDDLLEENKIKNKNYVHESLPGGHHFDGNIDELARIIFKYSN